MSSTPPLSSAAYLAAVSYILMALVIFAIPFDTPEASYHNLSNRIVFVLTLVIPMSLSVFSINCMSINSGKWCTSWAWVQAVMVAVWVAVFVWMILSHVKRQPQTERKWL